MINGQKSMKGLPPIEQARRALRHVLTQIRDRSEVGWYLGHGTETFALTTEAFAEIDRAEVVDVRRDFAPVNPIDPSCAPSARAKPAPIFDDEEVAALRKLAEHHDEMALFSRTAAGRTGNGLGYGLFMQADQHDAWSDLIESAIGKGGAS